MDENTADFCLAILFGSLKREKREIEYLYFYTISITSCKNIHQNTADFCLAILFGSLKREKREIEYLFCNSISKHPIKTWMKRSQTFVWRFFLGL